MSGRRSRKVQLMDPLVGLGPTAARSTSGPTIQQTAPDHRGQQRSVILPGSEAMSDEISRSLDRPILPGKEEVTGQTQGQRNADLATPTPPWRSRRSGGAWQPARPKEAGSP